MDSKTKRVRRDDGDALVGNIITGVKEANFISLVKRPANQRAISIIRSEQEDTEVSTTTKAPTTTRVNRAKRSDAAPVAKVTFPATYTDEAVTATLAAYGLSSFEVARSDESIVASRSDLKSIAIDTLTDIKLTADGIVASVVRADGVEATSGKKELALVSFEFSSDTFSRADAKAWLDENSVDFDDKALDNSTGNFVLQRADVDAGEEVRQIELAPGVVANVARSDVLVIPDSFVTVISETAYGNWGWGQLDFDAKLADVEVGSKLRKGLEMLDDILRDVLFYSSLPIDSRKELCQRSLNQFAAYATGLLDTLPRQLLVQVGSAQRSDKAQEPVNMTIEAKDTDTLTITRGDLKALVMDAIRESKEPAAPAAEPAAVPAAEGTESAPAATAAITREDMANLLKEAVAPLAERLEKVESTTIVRSDTPDPSSTADVKAKEEASMTPAQLKAKREDVFGNIDLGFGAARK
jgi:hypothetical protein